MHAARQPRSWLIFDVGQKMRAFISYSVADKEWGGRVKQALESINVHCFLAHEDMQVSEE